MSEELKKLVLEKRDDGKLVYATHEGFVSVDVGEFIKQPVDGILYDLNRLEETALTFIDDPKWVNDFAVALTIRELKSFITQLISDLEERTNQYHLAHAKISSRDAIIEQLSETQLAKDVTQLESTIAEITKLAKEPIVSVAGGEHDDALLRLVRIIEVLEGEDDNDFEYGTQAHSNYIESFK